MRVGLGLRLTFEINATGKIIKRVTVDDVDPWGPCRNILQKGDIINSIAETAVTDLTINKFVRLVSGEEGTTVKIGFARGGTNKTDVVARHFLKGECLRDIAKNQMRIGRRRRNVAQITKVFESHAETISDNQESKFLPKAKLLVALKEFDISSMDFTEQDLEQVDLIYQQLDRNGDGKLDLQEFILALRSPAMIDTIAEWVKSLAIHQLLADCFPRPQGEFPLLSMSKLSKDNVHDIVTEFSVSLEEILNEHIGLLKISLQKMKSRKQNSIGKKFESDLSKMECGAISDFHGGLTARIGVPHTDYEVAMHDEHCFINKDLSFDSINYKIKTNPCREWNFAVRSENCPDSEKVGNRVIRDVDELLRLETSRRAKLIRPEVIAMILYTGPMYYVYNTVLRRHPDDLYKVIKASGSLFSTTIFVLVSAVQKLSRVTVVEPGTILYRGISARMRLPDLFFKCDEYGCSGFTEWAFLSTTSKLDVARCYAKLEEGRDLPLVMAIHTGSVDRGASIRDYSQYPDEAEFLFVPCSFLEKVGAFYIDVNEQGITELVPVRVNSNLKARTVDELVDQKKDLHVAAFSYHIDVIRNELQRIAVEGKAEERLERDKSTARDDSLTVQEFLDRIVDQCKDVLSRHKAISSKEYLNDAVFRNLVLEMINVKAMAVSKLMEWLSTDSFIRFRWNASLRSVHRRWTAHLDQKRLNAVQESARSQAALELCKARGYVIESVDERNDLDETVLMCAAAEGQSTLFELLLDAGAQVNKARSDGVTAMWLAAEYGHENCIETLAKLKASVDQTANDGTSPLCIAARNGRLACVKMLHELQADVNLRDKFDSSPLHHAALYGQEKTVELLLQLNANKDLKNNRGYRPVDIAKQAEHAGCVKLLFVQAKPKANLMQSSFLRIHNRNLIISTGDINDVDGFFALAKYAQSGCDVLFIMNYPAYIGVPEEKYDPLYADTNPGLGYKYSAKQVLDNAPQPLPDSYQRFLERYPEVDSNARMKRALTDLAFVMANRVWTESIASAGVDAGKLLFAIGGINTINPFSEKSVKNEVLVYSDLVDPLEMSIDPEQGKVYDSEGKASHDIEWEIYSGIYIDFNGSLAFWNGRLTSMLSEKDIVQKIKGVFVMGGVYADTVPITMPSIHNVLNRFSSATMNQLYHPQNTADFFAFLKQFKVPTWTVSSNTVSKLGSFEEVLKFLDSNKLTSGYLKSMAEKHYNSAYHPPKKPFDYYVALALCDILERNKGELRTRFFAENLSALEPATELLSPTGASENLRSRSPERRQSLPHRVGQSARAERPCSDIDISSDRSVSPVRGGSFSGNSERPMTLFYSNVYGITLLGYIDDDWNAARARYAQAIETTLKLEESDSEYYRCKKETFLRELELMMRIDCSALFVSDLAFILDPATLRLRLPRLCRTPSPVLRHWQQSETMGDIRDV